MVQVCIAVLGIIALSVMSLRANRRFKQAQQLPMQWSLSGGVNWTVSRPLALAFTPVLAATILIGVALATIVNTPRSGREGLGVPVVTVMCLSFLAAHVLHLWLIERRLKADGS